MTRKACELLVLGSVETLQPVVYTLSLRNPRTSYTEVLRASSLVESDVLETVSHLSLKRMDTLVNGFTWKFYGTVVELMLEM